MIEVASSLARRFSARADDVEDIAQEALLKFLTYNNTIQDPIAWLYVVVRRLARRRANQVQGSSGELSRTVNPWPALELRIDSILLLETAQPRGRTAVRLSLAGYTESEIAARLGCTVKAAEKSLHSTRRLLRALVAKR